MQFEYFKKNTAEEISNVSMNLPFDESKAQIITIDTAQNKMSKSSREDYESYLNDVYRIILTKLFYSLYEVEPVLYWPKIDSQQNWIPMPSSTYAFNFDETKYNSQSFVDDFKKTMIETGKFSERGFCIDIRQFSHYITDLTGDKQLYPTEEQQKTLDSFNEIR